MACLGAIEKLGWPLDDIIHAEVWATDDIPAELPDMVAFKKKADAIIKERWGIEVKHCYAVDKNGEKNTFEKIFERKTQKGVRQGQIYGWPASMRKWCNSMLKMSAINKLHYTYKGCVEYIGIAADETKRIERHKNNALKMMPLVEVGWTEADCMQWCKDNDLLSPQYSVADRAGCWFCPFQTLAELRHTYRNYPELWQLLRKWDADCEVYHFNQQHPIEDYTRRFAAEQSGLIDLSKPFHWKDLDKEKKQP